MARRDRQRERQPEPHPPGSAVAPPRATATKSEIQNPKSEIALTWLALTLALAWLVLYFQAAPERLAVWKYALLPDELPIHWTGFDFDSATFTLEDRWPIWGLGLSWMLAGTAAGWVMLRLLDVVQDWTAGETLVLSAGLGMALASTATFLVGWQGAMRVPWLFLVVTTLSLILAAGWLAFDWWRARRDRAPSDQEPIARVAWSTRVLSFWPWLAAAPFVAVYVLAGPLPPTDFDVREYHLQAPKEWFQRGRIEFLPHNVYANMPLGTEMHALGAMCLARDLGARDENAWRTGIAVGKTIVSLTGVWLALSAGVFASRWFGSRAGAIAGLLTLGTPWLIHVAANGLNDGALAWYALLALHVATSARDNPRRWLIAGLLAGAAMAVKYTGGPLVVIPVVAGGTLAALRSREVASWRSRAIIIAAAALGVGLIAGPWLIKNTLATGNPVYPLLANRLGGTTRTPELAARWSKVHSPQPDAQGRKWSLGQLGSSAASIGWRSEWSPAVLWPLAIVGALIAWRNPASRSIAGAFAAAIAWMLVVWWGATHRIDRFWLPIVPLAAVLAGAVVSTCDDRWRQTTLGVALFVALGTAWWQAVTFVIDGEGEDVRPRLRSHDVRFFATLKSLSAQAPPWRKWLDERWAATPAGTSKPAVLLVGDAAPLELAGPVFYNTCFDECWLEKWLAAKSPEDAAAELTSRNIAWVIVDWNELARYRAPGNYGYSDYPTPETLASWVDAGVLQTPVRLEDGVDAYGVAAKPGPDKP